jgi:hypothetical protein
MNNPKTFLLLLCLTLFGCTATAEQSDTQNFRVRLYFGLSLPQGGGVSLKQWHDFQNTVLAKTFDGFNVVDSTGFYKGQPERSKIVTILTNQQGMPNVRPLDKCIHASQG